MPIVLKVFQRTWPVCQLYIHFVSILNILFNPQSYILFFIWSFYLNSRSRNVYERRSAIWVLLHPPFGIILSKMVIQLSGLHLTFVKISCIYKFTWATKAMVRPKTARCNFTGMLLKTAIVYKQWMELPWQRFTYPGLTINTVTLICLASIGPFDSVHYIMYNNLTGADELKSKILGSPGAIP